MVDGADDIRVEFTDGRTLTAKLVGTDKPSDLALLKVEATDLRPLALGNSDAVQVGDVVLAVGNPLGIGQTVTMGIVSAKGRSTGVGDGSYEDFLQTDAPINHGNSGGALVNTKGELVGINSQILSESERQHRHRLRDSGEHGAQRHGPAPDRRPGHARAAWRHGAAGDVRHGGEPRAVRDARRDRQLGDAGQRGGARGRQARRRHQVVQRPAGHDTNTLRNRVAEAAPGSSATVVIVRDGSEKTLTVKLDEASATESARDATGSTPETTDRRRSASRWRR